VEAFVATELLYALYLSSSVFQCKVSGLKDVHLVEDDSRLVFLPMEIRRSSFDVALQYVYDLAGAPSSSSVSSHVRSVPTYRSKVMLVGLQAVGKSSLLLTMFPSSGQFMLQEKSTFLRTKTTLCEVVLRGCVLVVNTGGEIHRVTLSEQWECKSKGKYFRVQPIGRKPARVLSLSHVQCTTMRGDLADEYIRHSKCFVERVAFEFSFADSKAKMEWLKKVSHWTNNSATNGIETQHHEVVRPYLDAPLQLCFMDFAGQQEYVDRL
jgi:GTPase SAR1 family protein